MSEFLKEKRVDPFDDVLLRDIERPDEGKPFPNEHA